MSGLLLVLRPQGETRGEASHEVLEEDESGEEALFGSSGEPEPELWHEVERIRSGLRVNAQKIVQAQNSEKTRTKNRTSGMNKNISPQKHLQR